MIKPKEQRFTQSCLLVALAMVSKVEMSKKIEGELLVKGLDRKYNNYMQGMLFEFVKKYKTKLKVYIHFALHAKNHKAWAKDISLINVITQKYSLAILKKLLNQGSVIIYLDAKYLEYDCYADHMPHFVVVEEIEDTKVTILDPWEGKRKKIKVSSLEEGVRSLRTKFQYSPVIITL
jgi:hypothetical protein